MDHKSLENFPLSKHTERRKLGKYFQKNENKKNERKMLSNQHG